MSGDKQQVSVLDMGLGRLRNYWNGVVEREREEGFVFAILYLFSSFFFTVG